MKQDASYFADREPILIYIAKRLRDALKLEALLTESGIDYGVEADEYRGGVIFRSVRAGAFFYVLEENANAAREVLRRHNYVPYEGAGTGMPEL
jgi:hypothetical protein